MKWSADGCVDDDDDASFCFLRYHDVNDVRVNPSFLFKVFQEEDGCAQHSCWAILPTACTAFLKCPAQSKQANVYYNLQ